MKHFLITLIFILVSFMYSNSQSNPDDNWSSQGGVCGSNIVILVSKFHPVTSDLYVAGQFQTIGGIFANNIARWDGSQWHSLGSGTSGQIRDMIFKNGELIVVGSFLQAGGISSGKVAKWNGTNWESMHLTNNTQGNLAAIEVLNDTIYVANGNLPTMYKRSGNSWIQFNNSPNNITDLHVANDTMYIAGYQGLHLYDGQTFTHLSSSGQNNIVISALASKGDSIIIVGSGFKINGVNINNAAIYDGTNFSAFGTFNSPVNCVHVFNNEVYVSGGFNNAPFQNNLRKFNSSNTWVNVVDIKLQ